MPRHTETIWMPFREAGDYRRKPQLGVIASAWRRSDVKAKMIERFNDPEHAWKRLKENGWKIVRVRVTVDY